MRHHAWLINTYRIVRDYAHLWYEPSAEGSERLTLNVLDRAKALATWKTRIRQQWPQLRIDRVWADNAEGQGLKVGDQLQVQAQVFLADLKPTDVAVELFHGPLDTQGLIGRGEVLPTLIAQSKGKGTYIFAGAISCRTSGRQGYAVRIVPKHEDLDNPFEMNLILWGG